MRRALLFICVLATALAVAFPLGAHTEVRARAPGARQEVGGVVDHVDIVYWSPGVRTASIEVIGPNGAIDVGETIISETNTVASVEFEPLTDPGDYIVRHKELSADGDETDALFAFSFNPESSNEVASFVDRGSGGPNWLILGGVFALLLVAVGVLWPGRK